jgi:histidyl-tRNA synthetase
MSAADPRDQLIEPRVLKGFRDYLPETMLVRERLMETARGVFRSYGFAPIDTPALEYAEILLGKGGDESDKQLFRFRDQGDRDVALRFDLTVPLARFAAQHWNQLGLPFRRYHLGSVWRGENTQKGRYREFVQCDFDTIGTTSLAADIDTLLVIHDLLVALGFSRFTIRVNNRRLLNGLLSHLGLAERTVSVLRSLDKLAKIGVDGVTAELMQYGGLTSEQAATVLALARPDATLEELQSTLSDCPAALDGLTQLQQLLHTAVSAGVPAERLKLDVSIARGLDYYTGTIYETFLNDLPGIGSICSGGRYDNLAGLFTKTPLPGVGASLGLDRLLAAMEELGLLGQVATAAPILMTYFDAGRLADYSRTARRLRSQGWNVEVYPEPIALGKQLKYASRKGFAVAMIAGSQEFEQHEWQLKQLATGESQRVADAELEAALQPWRSTMAASRT